MEEPQQVPLITLRTPTLEQLSKQYLIEPKLIEKASEKMEKLLRDKHDLTVAVPALIYLLGRWKNNQQQT